MFLGYMVKYNIYVDILKFSQKHLYMLTEFRIKCHNMSDQVLIDSYIATKLLG